MFHFWDDKVHCDCERDLQYECASRFNWMSSDQIQLCVFCGTRLEPAAGWTSPSTVRHVPLEMHHSLLPWWTELDWNWNRPELLSVTARKRSSFAPRSEVWPGSGLVLLWASRTGLQLQGHSQKLRHDTA